MPPIKRHRLENWIESRLVDVLYSGDPSQVQIHLEAKNKEMEEYLPSKRKAKKKKKQSLQFWSLIKDFKPTNIKKEKERHYTLYNGKGINARRRGNYHKYICTQY